MVQLVLRELASVEELLYFFDIDCVKLGKLAAYIPFVVIDAIL